MTVDELITDLTLRFVHGTEVTDVVLDLASRLKTAEATRDAAQAEATKQTLRARELAADLAYQRRYREDLASCLKDHGIDVGFPTEGHVIQAAIDAIAELHIRRAAVTALLEGLKLIGFSVWSRQGAHAFAPTAADRRFCRHCDGDEATHQRRYNVTFPARTYSVNGDRRSFALLRPQADATGFAFNAAAQERVRDLIIDAYKALAIPAGS